MGRLRNFVHLHVHTDYSLLDGACDISKLVTEAARRGMPAVAVTDHGNLFAAEQFYDQALAHGVKPIIGCEVYVARGSQHERKTEAGQRGVNHLVLLCETPKVTAISSGWPPPVSSRGSTTSRASITTY